MPERERERKQTSGVRVTEILEREKDAKRTEKNRQKDRREEKNGN